MINSLYFEHDYSARDDKNIIPMMMVHDYYGYGVYWAIIELLYKNGGVLPRNYETVAYTLHAKAEVIKSIVESFELFELSENSFTSNRVKRFIEKMTKISEARAKAGALGGKSKANANQLSSNKERERVREENKKLFSDIEKYGKEKGVGNLETRIDNIIDQYEIKTITKAWQKLQNRDDASFPLFYSLLKSV